MDIAKLARQFGPAVTAAIAFGLTDVMGKVVFAAGGDVLTMVTVRGVIGLALMFCWLRYVGWPAAVSARERWIGLGLGILFAGVIYSLFRAIDAAGVPSAVLTYFSYPLLTGIAAAATGIERLGWRGAAAAVTAFIGLALIIGAHPGGLALSGLGFALMASVCRTAYLLIARATLSKTDPRLSTWYSLSSSTLIFVVGSAATANWQPPHNAGGWIAIVAIGFTTVIAILALFRSTSVIGPFRSALIMNIEPLLVAILSAAFLGDMLTPLQTVGGIIMIAALVLFQLRGKTAE